MRCPFHQATCLLNEQRGRVTVAVMRLLVDGAKQTGMNASYDSSQPHCYHHSTPLIMLLDSVTTKYTTPIPRTRSFGGIGPRYSRDWEEGKWPDDKVLGHVDPPEILELMNAYCDFGAIEWGRVW